MKPPPSSSSLEPPLQARLCPVCDQSLVVFELEGIEVECCMECRGVWLEAGELEWICAGPDGHPPPGLQHAIGQPHKEKKSRRRCPRCRRRLRSFRLPGDPGVVIDRCPKGHGLWFDRGELESVVEEYPEGHAGTVAKFLHELFRHDLQTQSKGVDNP